MTTNKQRVKNTAFRVLCFASVTAVHGAQSVVQSGVLETSNVGNLYQGAGTEDLVSSGFFAARFEPFDSSLGTLVSFTVNCEIQGKLDGSVQSEAATGNASGTLGGTFLLGDIAFDGTGGSTTGEAGAGEVIEVEFGIPSYQKELKVSDAGLMFNPALLDLVTGEQSFEFTYTSGVSVGFESIEDLNAGVEATLTMTYTYEPPEGGLASLRIIKIFPDPESHEVEIEWISSPGKSYRVEAGKGVSELDFSVIQAEVTGSEGTTTRFVEEAVGPANRKRFYRVIENE